jgi:hypothetical protein
MRLRPSATLICVLAAAGCSTTSSKTTGRLFITRAGS